MILYDGQKEIRSIGVVLMLRDNADYIRDYLSKTIPRMERLYTQCQFEYYIFENDSVDDTVGLIADFMKTRKGMFFTEKLGLETGGLRGVEFARIVRISKVRNMLWERIRNAGCIQKHDWFLFLDSELYFDELVLSLMMSWEPAKNNIGMLTCKSLAIIDRKDNEPDVSDKYRYVTHNHYYDTFAFTDINNRMHYPSCVNPACIREECLNDRMNKTFRWRDDSVMDVRSAWAGVVMIDARILEHPAICWKPLLIKGMSSLSEHAYFCDVLAATSGKRIVVCPNTECYWKAHVI